MKDQSKLGLLSKIFGVVFTILIAVVTFQLPDNFPNILIPLLYSSVAAAIVWQYHVTKEEKEATHHYAFKSNWYVAAISILSLMITMVVFLAVVFFFVPGV